MHCIYLSVIFYCFISKNKKNPLPNGKGIRVNDYVKIGIQVVDFELH